MNKRALIFGSNGQDASYLSELLLDKGYAVYGAKRRSSTENTERIKHLFGNPNFKLIEADVTDGTGVFGLIERLQPNEIYNTAAMSHVGTSFDQPITTFEINAIGVLNILEAIRQFSPSSKLYHCSTSELWGNEPPPHNELSRMKPRSPYGISKLAAHELVGLYRDAYKIFACAGILANHESPRRGENFVTRKITKYVAHLMYYMNKNNARPIKNVHIQPLMLGNLDAKRDWSHAADMVRGMYMMLQQEKPKDYVLGSGTTRTVREFCDTAFKYAGLDFYDYVEIDPNLLRPAEVNVLCADASLAEKELGWEPLISFKELVEEMIESDLNAFKNTQLCSN